ncbi:hypothetical protein C1H46_035113 [Malus baccata]|uniref:Uncharacterized protein n=1 Tax=Malus baccata TaxID=106549 RepID=A0A540KZ25_MALBA|nr:hypothetical protein C1H46_035113 [Malus baccata]
MDCAIDLVKLDASIKLADTGDVIACEREEREKLETIPKDTAIAFASKSGSISDHSGNDIEDLGFEVLDGLWLSESNVAFKEVKSVENFNVLVNGLNINSEFSKHLLTKSKRFKEARLEKEQAEEEMRSLEAKLLVVKDAINMLDSEIESLNTSLEKLEHMFQEVAKAPW